MGDVLTTITCFMCVLCSAVEVMRESFMMDIMDTHHGFPRPIKRANIYDDVIETYQENIGDILQEYTLFVYGTRTSELLIQGECAETCFLPSGRRHT